MVKFIQWKWYEVVAAYKYAGQLTLDVGSGIEATGILTVIASDITATSWDSNKMLYSSQYHN